MNQVTSTPYPVNRIDPFLSEKILFGIGIFRTCNTQSWDCYHGVEIKLMWPS